MCAALIVVVGCEPAGKGRVAGPQAPENYSVSMQLGSDEGLQPADIDRGMELHRAAAQLYRWFLYYDNDVAKFQDHLDILSGDATFQNDDGTFSTREKYVQRALNIPRGMENAHFVRNIRADFTDDKRVRLDTDIIYLNRGALDDDRIHSNHLSYSMLMVNDSEPLPLVEEVKIKAAQGGITPSFRRAYSENRMRMVLHYWLGVLEDKNCDMPMVEPIFDNVFTVSVPGHRFTSLEELMSWFKGSDYPKFSIHHQIRRFTMEELVANEYEIEVDLDRYFTVDGEVDKVMVRQNILVKDSPGDTFPKITLITERTEATIKAEEAQASLAGQ